MESRQGGQSRWGGWVRWVFPLALVATIIFASSHHHVPGLGGSGRDKVVHFAVFGLLATLCVRLVPRRVAWTVVLAVSLFGASDEWHQSFVPGRTMDWADWVADTAGALVAVLAYTRWKAYRGLLETPVRTLCRNARIENPSAEASTEPLP